MMKPIVANREEFSGDEEYRLALVLVAGAAYAVKLGGVIWEWRFGRHVVVNQEPVGPVLKQRQMRRLALIVADVK
jgi:hypothetical protein